jgi:protein TonB
LNDFRRRGENLQAPLSAPTYLTHVTVPLFRRGRAIAIAVAAHLIAILAILLFLHIKNQPIAPNQPTIMLIVQSSPLVGAGPQTISPPTQQALPEPHALPPRHPVSAQLPAPVVKSAAALPRPAPPPAPAAKPAAPPAASRPGDNQPLGAGLVRDAKIIPARPDTSNLPPPYPPEALQHGEQGRVLLSIHVLPSGRPDNIAIATSSGFAVLDTAARDAVMQWHFLPAVQLGKPVASVLPFWISFQLN